MISIVHLFKYLFVLTRRKFFSLFVLVKYFFFVVVLCCQIQLARSFGNNDQYNDIDIGEDLYETLPIQHHRLHQNFRRASLRYHPHVLYKKASLRPIIGQNGKVTFTT